MHLGPSLVGHQVPRLRWVLGSAGVDGRWMSAEQRANGADGTHPWPDVTATTPLGHHGGGPDDYAPAPAPPHREGLPVRGESPAVRLG